MPVIAGQRPSLAPHVRACLDGDQVILLDLRRNRYLGIPRAQSCALGEQVDGWPKHPERTGARASPATSSAIVQGLVSQGLLTYAPSVHLPAALLGEATSSLDFGSAASSSITARRLGRFLRSAAVTALWMRCLSLHSIAMAVDARRERLCGDALDPTAIERIRSGAAAYERLRPLAMSAQDKCLHDSLALVGFLALERAFPRWVIGVKTRPFGAHSWVQSGGTVLNDQHENVRRFRPILIV